MTTYKKRMIVFIILILLMLIENSIIPLFEETLIREWFQTMVFRFGLIAGGVLLASFIDWSDKK